MDWFGCPCCLDDLGELYAYPLAEALGFACWNCGGNLALVED